MRKLLTTTAVDGARVSFDPADLHHRVDETRFGLRYASAFTQGHVLWSRSEAEMIAVLSLTVMKHSQTTQVDYTESASWAYSIQDLKAQVIPPTLSPLASRAWQQVSADTRETFPLFVEMLAVHDFAHYLSAGHFKTTVSPLSPNYDAEAHAVLLAPSLARADDDGLIRWADRRINDIQGNSNRGDC